ncbi:hypothetical protein TREES_T100007895 [Tupaia chinensis]|uniref:Uncharacterized protein n=1 Tax=Tupaia chinensis TaxID=246437 RepID=L9JDS7_TUPCH|nr:hypothetical protein TREES_T100007895 [Tupaia chinensis]
MGTKLPLLSLRAVTLLRPSSSAPTLQSPVSSTHWGSALANARDPDAQLLGSLRAVTLLRPSSSAPTLQSPVSSTHWGSALANARDPDAQLLGTDSRIPDGGQDSEPGRLSAAARTGSEMVTGAGAHPSPPEQHTSDPGRAEEPRHDERAGTGLRDSGYPGAPQRH